MTKKSGQSKAAADKLVKSIRRKTRQTYSSEEKIRIVLAGLRGEESISALCKDSHVGDTRGHALVGINLRTPAQLQSCSPNATARRKLQVKVHHRFHALL